MYLFITKSHTRIISVGPLSATPLEELIAPSSAPLASRLLSVSQSWAIPFMKHSCLVALCLRVTSVHVTVFLVKVIR